MLAHVGPDVRRQDADALFALFAGISRLDVEHRLAQIRVPCHVFSGSHDPVVPTTQSPVVPTTQPRRIAQTVPGARAVVFRGVGHMPLMEDTAAWFEALEHAISDLSGDGEAPCGRR